MKSFLVLIAVLTFVCVAIGVTMYYAPVLRAVHNNNLREVAGNARGRVYVTVVDGKEYLVVFGSGAAICPK